MHCFIVQLFKYGVLKQAAEHEPVLQLRKAHGVREAACFLSAP